MSRFVFVLSLVCLIYTASAQGWWESGSAKTLTDENFDKLVGKDKHVIIEFFAEFCTYCRMMHSEWNKLSDMYLSPTGPRKDVLVAKVNAGVYQDLGQRYGVQNYPTIMIFRKGQMFPASRYYQNERTAVAFSAWIDRVVGAEETAAEPTDDAAAVGDDDEKDVTATLESIEQKVTQLVKLMNGVDAAEGLGKALKSGNSEIAEAIAEINKKLDNGPVGAAGEINFSHAMTFLLMGVLLGVGVSFTFINYKKLGKKKTLAD